MPLCPPLGHKSIPKKVLCTCIYTLYKVQSTCMHTLSSTLPSVHTPPLNVYDVHQIQQLNHQVPCNKVKDIHSPGHHLGLKAFVGTLGTPNTHTQHPGYGQLWARVLVGYPTGNALEKPRSPLLYIVCSTCSPVYTVTHSCI